MIFIWIVCDKPEIFKIYIKMNRNWLYFTHSE